MKVSEIVQLERSNQDEIILIKEGYFWRAYEKSALRFIQFIQEFQVVKRKIKYLNQEIVFLGFPNNIFPKIKEKIWKANLEILEESDDLIKIGSCVNAEDFISWKKSIQLSEISVNNKKEEDKKSKNIVEEISNFSTINKTPLEAMQFVIELQSKVR